MEKPTTRLSILMFAAVLATAALGARAENLEIRDDRANLQADWQGPGGPGQGGPGWGPSPPPPPPPSFGLPNGSYLNSCEQCNFDGRTLSCYCRGMRGYEAGTSIGASCCRSPIDNVNGQLYCQ
jgi:hypothetical protein